MEPLCIHNSPGLIATSVATQADKINSDKAFGKDRLFTIVFNFLKHIRIGVSVDFE